MDKNTNIIFRVNDELKNSVTKIAKENGATLSQLITAFLVSIDHEGRVPYDLNKYLPLKFGKEKVHTISHIRKCVSEVLKDEYYKNVDKVFLFGSYSRKEATSKSDIDLRIETKQPFGLIVLGNLHLDLEEKLNKKVDLLAVDMDDIKDEKMKKEVERDQICIFERQN